MRCGLPIRRSIIPGRAGRAQRRRSCPGPLVIAEGASISVTALARQQVQACHNAGYYGQWQDSRTHGRRPASATCSS
jgi:hypothetical protein